MYDTLHKTGQETTRRPGSLTKALCIPNTDRNRGRLAHPTTYARPRPKHKAPTRILHALRGLYLPAQSYSVNLFRWPIRQQSVLLSAKNKKQPHTTHARGTISHTHLSVTENYLPGWPCSAIPCRRSPACSRWSPGPCRGVQRPGAG